jgi:YD repeat-containing protein
MSNHSGVKTYCCDTRGNVIRKRQATPGGFIVDYRYNLADRLIGMTYPSGALIGYSRSLTTGRVTSVSFQPHVGGPVTAIASGFTWQPFGPLTGYTAGNGNFHWRQYTLNGAPQSINGPGLASTYTVDVLGNFTALTSGATQQYQYDALNRLHRVDNASLQRIDAWTYDGTGNRLSRQAGKGPVLPLTYPPTSHRVSVAGVARSYDANGNTIARGSESLFYGDHNRLVSWSGAFGMSSASHRHNARGERVWKQSMAGAASMGGNKLPPECLAVQGLIMQSFLYDEAGRVIVDRNDPCSDRPLTNFEFVWLDDQPLAMIDGAGRIAPSSGRPLKSFG